MPVYKYFDFGVKYITSPCCCWNIWLEILHILPHFFHILKKSTYKTSFSPKPFLGHKISHKFLPSTSSFSLSFPSLSVSHFPSAAFTPSNSSFLSQFPPSCLLLTPFSFYSTILLILFFINDTHTVSLSQSLWRTEASVWELTGGGFRGFGTNCRPF